MKKLLGALMILGLVLSSCNCKKSCCSKTEKPADSKISEEAKLAPDVDVKVSAQKVSKEVLSKEKQDEYASYLKVSDSLLVKMQRTACFGRCPIYTVEIFKGGFVRYEGKNWVDKLGFFHSKISQESIDKLLAKADEVGFFKLNKFYDNESITDLPSTITLVRSNDQLKAVVSRYQSPEKLKEFENMIDESINQLTFSKEILE